MNPGCDNSPIWRGLASAVCLTALLQLGAGAQAAADTDPQAEKAQSPAAAPKPSADPVNYYADFDPATCATKSAECAELLAALQAEAEQAPTAEPNIKLRQPEIRIRVRAEERKIDEVGFSEPEAKIGTAPRTFHASAYSLRGRTRTGATTRPGVMAADPRVLPLGSVVQVKAGDYSGVYTVHDIGGAIKGHRVDIWLPSQREALRFGRRSIKLAVLRYGPARRAEKVKDTAKTGVEAEQ